jgi:threonine/homoserine/homoserine lactone efflux protein
VIGGLGILGVIIALVALIINSSSSQGYYAAIWTLCGMFTVNLGLVALGIIIDILSWTEYHLRRD